MEKLKKLLNRETVLYLIFGVATTVVNYIVFFLVYAAMDKQNSPAANAVAFAAAVAFAFVVNKMYVFESKSWSMECLTKEVPPFLAARIGSFLIEEAGLFLCEDVWNLGNAVIMRLGEMELTGVVLAKLVLSVMVVVLNYIFCKWLVFKK